MIYVEVIKSREPLALGVYEYEFDQIFLGRSKKNDLIFLDPELPLKFMVIKFVQDQLVVQSLTAAPYFFINGKKISGTLKLKPGDVIAFGENQIRVLKAIQSKDNIDYSALQEELSKKSPEIKFALDFIEEVLLELEEDHHV
jgi:hypothetical protein